MYVMTQFGYANNVLQEAINKAKAGSRLDLPAGIYHGNIVIDKPLIIDGKNKKAIIEGDGTIGSCIHLYDVHVP